MVAQAEFFDDKGESNNGVVKRDASKTAARMEWGNCVRGEDVPLPDGAARHVIVRSAGS
jgi:hypothetical protein